MSVRIYLALLSINLHFNLLSSWAMQIEANLRVQGGSRGHGHGSAGMIKLWQGPWYAFRKTCSVSSGNNKKKGGEKKKKNKTKRKAETIPYGEK